MVDIRLAATRTTLLAKLAGVGLGIGIGGVCAATVVVVIELIQWHRSRPDSGGSPEQ